VRRELVSREVVAMTNTAAEGAAALFQSVPVLDIIRLVVKRERKKKIGKSIYH
jgi:hypothetical protein